MSDTTLYFWIILHVIVSIQQITIFRAQISYDIALTVPSIGVPNLITSPHPETMGQKYPVLPKWHLNMLLKDDLTDSFSACIQIKGHLHIIHLKQADLNGIIDK